MKIEQIQIQNLLPQVFKGMEDSEAVRESGIWLAGDVKFDRGCKICVQAESGRGKSSLLSFIYGDRTDYDGTITYNGENVRGFSVDRWCELRSCHIALLPQEMRLFPELTVIQNIEIKNKRTGHKTLRQIEGLLERLGIAEKIDQPCGKLSIGQQQRVALLRTICQPFDFIFLDEPVSHLDAGNNRIVARIIEEEAARNGAGIISTSVGNHLALDAPQFITL